MQLVLHIDFGLLSNQPTSNEISLPETIFNVTPNLYSIKRCKIDIFTQKIVFFNAIGSSFILE